MHGRSCEWDPDPCPAHPGAVTWSVADRAGGGAEWVCVCGGGMGGTLGAPVCVQLVVSGALESFDGCVGDCGSGGEAGRGGAQGAVTWIMPSWACDPL